MHWHAMALRDLAHGRSAAAPLDVWWWPDALHPDHTTRRERIDAILRTLLASYVGWPAAALRFEREAHGRPFLAHAHAPDFNLTDTAGGALIVVAASGRVGVDCERGDRRVPVAKLARRWYTTAEAAALAALDDASARRAFLNLWTAKEAACKTTGTGIFGYLSAWRFAVDASAAAPQLRDLPTHAGEACRWTFHRLAPTPAHTAVLACRDLSEPPRGFIVTA